MKKLSKFLPLPVLGLLVSSLLLAPVVFADTSLITRWKFDETTAGDTVVDSSSSGFDGTPHGRNVTVPDDDFLPQPSTDVPPVAYNNPRSLFFQGDGSEYTGSYIDVSNWNVDTTNGFTVALWAKPTTTGVWERFIDFGDGPGQDNIVFAQLGGTNRVFFEVYNGGSTTKIEGPSGSWMIGSWHYYAATVDENGNAVIYIDGQEVVSGTTNKPLNVSRANKYIGKSNWGDSYYEGYMDDLRFYNRALTEEEVQGLTDGDEGPGVENDGVDQAVEDAAPNNGDANNDSIADSQQGNVASFLNGQTNKYSVVEVPQACALSSVSAAAEAGNSVTDAEYSYPAGFMNFTASCGSAGYTADVTLYFYGQSTANLLLRKYNPNTQAYATVNGAVISEVTIGGQQAAKVTYQVTDGGPLDSDGTANGVIVDPVGLALGAQTLVEAGGSTLVVTLIAVTVIATSLVIRPKAQKA